MTPNLPELIKKYQDIHDKAYKLCVTYADKNDTSSRLDAYDLEQWTEAESIMTLASAIIKDLKAMLTPMGQAIYGEKE